MQMIWEQESSAPTTSDTKQETLLYGQVCGHCDTRTLLLLLFKGVNAALPKQQSLVRMGGQVLAGIDNFLRADETAELFKSEISHF